MTFDEAMREVLDGNVVQRAAINLHGQHVVSGHVRLFRNRVISVNPYNADLFENYILTVSDYAATDWTVIV